MATVMRYLSVCAALALLAAPAAAQYYPLLSLAW